MQWTQPLKKYRGVIFDGTKYWCKIWRKTDLCFQKWHEEFGKFLPEHFQKSKNLDFYWILLSKVENVWAWNLQGCYVSWQWRMMKNLNRTWLVSSKLTWAIWRSLTRALKNLTNICFNGLLLTKVYNVWAKKIQRSYVRVHWRLMQSLKKNWFLLPKMTWGIWQIFTRACSKV